MTIDASDCGIGGVLEQEWPDGAHPVAYVSRKLSDSERNYPTHDRELLAIIHVIKGLRCYLHGTIFTIQTDPPHPLPGHLLCETRTSVSNLTSITLCR
jgi:RNase H-like domain found in reverse transcriptase